MKQISTALKYNQSDPMMEKYLQALRAWSTMKKKKCGLTSKYVVQTAIFPVVLQCSFPLPDLPKFYFSPENMCSWEKIKLQTNLEFLSFSTMEDGGFLNYTLPVGRIFHLDLHEISLTLWNRNSTHS